MQTIQFFLFLFLGTITLIRKAQQRSYFNKLDFPSALLGLLPHEEHGLANLKDSVEEGNINRVVTILQNNIKQWSFIEAQLLEPNVNLGMPEIFIPLNHLTTTLEILGNIFFMKNDLAEAKQCLERACPLMELLQPSLMENLGNTAGNSRDAFGFDNKHTNGGGFQKDGTPHSKNYAADCFSVLRKIYLKIYGDKISAGELPQLDDGNTIPAEDDMDFSDESLDDSQYDSSNFDADLKIEELRQPFQHLRSDLLSVQESSEDLKDVIDDNSPTTHSENKQPQVTDTRRKTLNSNTGHVSKPEEDSSSAADGHSDDGSSSNSNKRTQQSSTSSSSADTKATTTQPTASTKYRDAFLEGLHGYSSQNIPMDPSREAHLLGLGGSATSLIAADMEIMLRTFVKEDKAGRRSLFEGARKYYEDLDVNFPTMDLHEYAANMELGTVYLEVMARVVNEGFGFIAPELERWQEFGQNLLMRGTPPGHTMLHPLPPSLIPSVDLMAANSGDGQSGDRKNRFGVGIIWEIDPDTGMKKEFAVELDGSYFDSFSLQERNRLLVLSAFDIALNLEPDEQFDLSLGFSLGILDNDKTRHRDSMYHPFSQQDGANSNGRLDGSNGGPDDILSARHRQREHKRRPRQKSTTLENDVTAAMFEDQTLSTIGITNAMRSSVPTLKAEDDWTLHLFLAFMIATVLIVYLSYSESRKKQRNRQPRSNNRRNPDGFLGLFIRYLYPQYFDTDSSSGLAGSNSTVEPPMDTMTFLSELVSLTLQLDFIQWVIGLFYSSSADSIASTSNSSSTSSNSTSSSANKSSTSKRVSSSSTNAVDRNKQSSQHSQGFFQSFSQYVTGLISPSSTGNTTPAAHSSNSSSSTSVNSSATNHKSSAASASTAINTSANTSVKPAANKVPVDKLSTPQHHHANSSLPATSPESTDSSTDDVSSSTGRKNLQSTTSSTTTSSATSAQNKAVGQSGLASSNAKNTSKSNVTVDDGKLGQKSGAWSGSDRDDGFYSAYGISASEDEGWQAAGATTKRAKQQQTLTQPSQATNGRKSHDGVVKTALSSSATAAKPSSVPGTTTTTAIATANTTSASKSVVSAPQIAQKTRDSPALEAVNSKKIVDETAIEHMKPLPGSANSASSYAQRLTGAAASVASPASSSSTPAAIAAVGPGPSYKHAVVTKKDKESAWKTAATTPTASPQIIAQTLPVTPATVQTSLLSPAPSSKQSDATPRTATTAKNTPSAAEHQQQASSSVQPISSSKTAVLPSPATPLSVQTARTTTPQSTLHPIYSPPSAESSLFSNVFGHSSTPSFLLAGPTNYSGSSSLTAGNINNAGNNNSSSSLLFPSMSAAQPQFLFRDDSDLNLGFLSDPPLDAFATASSSPAKPSMLSQPPPGLSIARSSSQNNATLSASASGFDVLYRTGSNSGGVTTTSSSLFAGLSVDNASNNNTTANTTMPSSSSSLTTAQSINHTVEDDGYVSNFLSNMLEDFLQPGSPVPDLYSSSGLSQQLRQNNNAQGSNMLLSRGDQNMTHSSSSLLGSSSFGYVSAHQGMIAGTPAASLVESDLSPNAPVFLPSNMLQNTPGINDSLDNDEVNGSRNANGSSSSSLFSDFSFLRGNGQQTMAGWRDFGSSNNNDDRTNRDSM